MQNSSTTRFAYTLIAPTLLVIGLLLGYPLLFALLQSFQEVTVFQPRGVFIGIDHYVRAFSDRLFLASLLRSFIFAGSSLGGAILFGMVIALLLNRDIVGKKYMRVCMLLPFIVSEVSVGVIWQWMFSPQLGVINNALRFLSLPTIRWLSDPNWAMVSIIIANIWRLTPFPVLILLAGLQSIDHSYYEAAHIDGASAWQIFFNITAPLIKPMMLICVVYLSFASFNQFGTIYSLTGGGPGEATEVLALHMYATAFKHFNWGYGSALAVILFLVNVALSLGYAKVLEKEKT